MISSNSLSFITISLRSHDLCSGEAFAYASGLIPSGHGASVTPSVEEPASVGLLGSLNVVLQLIGMIHRFE
jgi:hypothetical protein